MPEKKFTSNDDTKNMARKISSLSNTLNKLETKVEGQKQVVSTTNKILQKLATAVETATSSIEKVATSSIRYTKEALSQYEKQIGQDININKKNLMALSITQATPVFGYFVSKFFETDIFQKTMQKIKDSFINGLKSVVDKVRGMITGTWGGLKRLVGLKKKEPFNEKVPKMAKGGYVSKGGLTRLHAAEVVMPIDKLLDRIDEKIETKSTSNISLAFKKFSDDQKETLNEYIKTSKQGSSKITDSVTKLDQSNRIYNREILESLSDIRVALAGYSKGIREWISSMFQNFLLKHPAIRAVYNISDWFLGKVRGLINFPFTRRGGYKKFLSKDPNAFNGTRDILNTTFVFSMEKYDTIIQLLTQQLTATQDMASAFTGKKYKTALHKTYPEYTIAGAFMRLIGRGAKGIGKIAAWEYRGVKKMLGKGGKTGAQTPSQEVSLVNITDKFGLLLDIQMKMLYQIEILVKQSINKDVYEIYMNREKDFQKKLLKNNYEERREAKKEVTWLKKISIGVSDFSEKLKLYAKKTGSLIWDGIKWLGGIIGGFAVTVWNLVPDWVKLGFGVGVSAFLLQQFQGFMEKLIPKFVDEIKRSIAGGKTTAEYKTEDKEKRKKEWEKFEKMSPFEILGKVFTTKPTIGGVKAWEEKYGVPGQKATMLERASITGITQMPKLAGIDILDTRQRNLRENAIKADREMRDKSGLKYLKAMKKKMSPDAFYMLSEGYRSVQDKYGMTINDVFQSLVKNSDIIQDENKKWVLRDEYFSSHAHFPQKAMVKALEQVSSNLASQVKDVQTHALKAEESRDIQNKNFADYIKGEMSSGAYKLLTRSGLDGVSDRYSAMLLNHQLIKHKGKVITLYEYLDSATKLSFQDRIKFIVGLRNIPEKDIPRLLGIMPLATKEGAEEIMNAAINKAIIMQEDPALYGTIGMERFLSNLTPAQTMAIAQQAEINKQYLENFEKMNKPFTSVLSEFGENFMQSLVEHESEIREAYVAPSIENAKIIGLEVKKEILKQRATLETNERIKDLGERTEKASISLNNLVNNAFNNTMSNATYSSAGQSQQNTQIADPNIQSILTGDLR